MAYSVSRPRQSGSGQSRGRPQVSTGYQSSLAGFTDGLSTVRKQLVQEQINQINYQIDTGISTIDEKIAVYENYLSSLQPDTSEWLRVSGKLQNLRDQASSEDFALAKKLYSQNQVSTEYYYEYLKERANEPNISQEERRSRLLDLSSFEDKIRREETDESLREAETQESLGMISSFERLEMIRSAYENATDPDRKARFQRQLISQQQKVFENELQTKELRIQKAINEGTATKEDLLAIKQQEIQTAQTEEERLRAEVSYQNLLEDIQSDRKARFNKQSQDIKSEVRSEVKSIDRKIERAKQKGDLVKIALLYGTKEQKISEFMSNPNVSDEDRQVSEFFRFSEEVLGKEIDPETGEVRDVVPTDDFNTTRIEDALSNPGSSALKKEYGEDGGVVGYELIRGEQVTITNPDGSTGVGYDYGDNNVFVNTVTQEFTDAEGNTQTIQVPEVVAAEQVPRAVELPRGNRDIQFTGESVTLGQTQDPRTGEIVDQVGYIVEGPGAGDYAGTTPIPGQPDRFVFTSSTGQVPVEEDLVRRPEALNPLTKIGANLQEKITTPFTNTLDNLGFNQLPESVQQGAGLGFDAGSRAAIASVIPAPGVASTVGSFASGRSIRNELPGVFNQARENLGSQFESFDLPDFGRLFNEQTRNVGQQLLGAAFPQFGAVSQVGQTAVNFRRNSGQYREAAQSAIERTTESVSETAGNVVSGAQQFGRNLFNNLRSGVNNLFSR